MIKHNLEVIRHNIQNACKVIQKKEDEIILVGVTKTVNLENMKTLFGLGVENFGENKVQEFVEKYDFFKKKVVWHQIGHLQTNKIKYIIDKVDLIHSVDSVRLAQQIDKAAAKHNKIMDILCEINISLESTKFGINPEELEDFIDKIFDLKNICIKGLMTIAPNNNFCNKDNRQYFEKMKKLYDRYEGIKSNNINFEYLSMGMTNDYEDAILEGSNMIRVGTGIFGHRK